MKKIVIAGIISMVVGMTAFGSATIDFKTSSAGAIVRDRLNVSAAPVNTWLVELFWSPDATIDPLNPLSPTAATGNDLLLRSFTPAQTAGRLRANDYLGASPVGTASTTQPYAETAYPAYTFGVNGLVTGYVYARLFETKTPVIGTYYHETAISGQIQAKNPDTGADTTLTYDVPSCYFDTQIVPEPGMIGLVAIGMAILAVVRRVRS